MNKDLKKGELLKDWSNFIDMLKTLRESEILNICSDCIGDLKPNCSMFVAKDGTVLNSYQVDKNFKDIAHNDMIIQPFFKNYGYNYDKLDDIWHIENDKDTKIIYDKSYEIQDYLELKHDWVRINSGTYKDKGQSYLNLPLRLSYNQRQVIRDFLYMIIDDGQKSVDVFPKQQENVRKNEKIVHYDFSECSSTNEDPVDYIMDRIDGYYRHGMLVEKKQKYRTLEEASIKQPKKPSPEELLEKIQPLMPVLNLLNLDVNDFITNRRIIDMDPTGVYILKIYKTPKCYRTLGTGLSNNMELRQIIYPETYANTLTPLSYSDIDLGLFQIILSETPYITTYASIRQYLQIKDNIRLRKDKKFGFTFLKLLSMRFKNFIKRQPGYITNSPNNYYEKLVSDEGIDKFLSDKNSRSMYYISDKEFNLSDTDQLKNLTGSNTFRFDVAPYAENNRYSTVSLCTQSASKANIQISKPEDFTVFKPILQQQLDEMIQIMTDFKKDWDQIIDKEQYTSRVRLADIISGD